MESSTLNTKLAGNSNWNLWKFQSKILFKSKNVFEIISGEEFKPTLAGLGNDQERYQDALKDWSKKDSKAQELIVMRMDEGPMVHILTCDTAKGMWDKLLSVYDKKSGVSLHLLQQKFFNLKYEGDGVAIFVSKIEEICNQLEQNGEKIPDQMKLTKILMSLPDKFKHFISAWDSVPARDKTLNELMSRLIIEEERMNQDNSCEVEAFSSLAPNINSLNKFRASSVKENNKQHYQKSIKCNFCGMLGHISRYCRKRSNNSFMQNQSKASVNERLCYRCKKPGHFIKDCKSDSNAFVSHSFISDENSGEDWIVDSGATEHMSCMKSLFSDYRELDVVKNIRLGNGSTVSAMGIGSIKLYAFNGKCWIDSVIENVLYVPDLKFNLFSVGTVVDKGYVQKVNENTCVFLKNNEVRCIGYRHGKLYKMKFRCKKCIDSNSVLNVAKEEKQISISNDNCSLRIWHEKLAHQNLNQVKQILKKNNINFKDESFFCEPCAQGKQHRLPFPTSNNKSTKPGEIVHADLCGPMEQTSLGGSRYFLLFKDDFSSYRTVYFIKNKFEVKDKLKIFLNKTENETGCKVKILRTDNGLEFVNKDIAAILENRGIHHQRSVAYTPEQNGKAEREMRTLVEAARTCIIAKSLSKILWAEAINFVSYVLNNTAKTFLEGQAPSDLWLKDSVSRNSGLENYYVFGSRVMVHVPKQKRLKWDAKSINGIFVGYDNNCKAFRIYIPSSNKLEIARDMIFVPDSEKVNTDTKLYNDEGYYILNGKNPEIDDYKLDDNITEPEVNGNAVINPEIAENDDAGRINEEKVSKMPALRDRSRLKKPSTLDDYVCIGVTDPEEPCDYEEAITCENSEKWKDAIKAEINVLNENNTWSEVNCPDECNIIDSKWVFRIKRENDNKIHYKARLVARGFLQKEVFDYSEIYAPVAKLPTVRTLLAVANKLNLVVYQMDVKSAFLYGDIEEDVYMYYPDGVENKSGKVLKLNKSIYGLKKSPKNWNEKINSFLEKENFIRSKNDYCLYVKTSGNDRTFIVLYVDDLLICGTNKENVDEIKIKLTKNFKMKDIGKISNYLGINIIQDCDKGVIKINQTLYLKSILKNYGMEDCKSIATPMDPNFKLEIDKNQIVDKHLETKCRKLIGSLMYAMLGSRPDLCLSISYLSRFQSYPSPELWNGLKRVLRYIKGTLDMNLILKVNSDCLPVVGFVDADWAGDVNDRKSTSGFVFKVFDSPVIWCSRKQSIVSLSSTEAEYVALAVATGEACWLRGILQDIMGSHYLKQPVTIFEDNQSTMRVAKTPENKRRLKHVDVKYHFIKEKISNGTIDIVYIPSDEQIADMFTKPLSKVKFNLFAKSVNLL